MPAQPWPEKCRICGAQVMCWAYGPDDVYDPDNDSECEGSFCDFGVRDGCFGHYCKGCFEKHRCGAYNGPETT